MNKPAQFTPGPWSLCNWMVGNNTPTGEVTICGPEGDEHICTMDGNEDNQANATLIVAAPVMYGTLLQVREMLLILADNAGDVPEWNTGGELYELAHTVRTALAQAEGVSHE